MSEQSNSDRVISGRYRLLEPIGRGGMGIVWRARDEVLAREVAVKEVRAPAGLEPAELERLYRRLEREAWAAARVSHRGVVTVYDVASEDGRPWIVMELVRGLSLADVLEAEGPMAPQRAAHIGEQVLAALRSAHDCGVLHRDVKPANVLIANDGRVVLGDFGIASLEGSSAITMTGEVVGSPEFLSPERALGNDPGPASDLWALGVMLYAAVEGATPFHGATPLDTLRAVVDAELPPPRRAGALEPVLEGLLRKDPAERLPAAEAAGMLRVVGAGGTVRASGGPVSGPDGPTTVAHHGRREHQERQGADEPPDPYGAQPTRVARPAHGSPYGTPPPEVREGHAGLVLTVGIVLMLLALVAVGWLLLGDRGNDGGTDGGNGAPTGSATNTRTVTTTPSTAPSAPVSASAPGAAGQHVSVYVDAVRSSYTGSCPPPAEYAPAFTATVEVEGTPVVLEYRWATRSGRTSGPDWQSVTYEEGGPRSRRVEHTELTHEPDGVFEDAVRLEVRGPAEVATQWVATSVTCRKETPTSGAPSPGPSPSPASPVPPTASPPASPATGEPDGTDGTDGTDRPAPANQGDPAGRASRADLASPGNRTDQAAFVKTGR
ncbi:serine/threonine-protein kinase [Streptomyces avidinii]|uniref:non-specific serine/threonine protein kinase n=1 Tax=Streptomyces avidinii TaxID=1895 RepID=A0ABS4LCP0_STRAV|nr:serine/threonine-protein kinase [Streptomyces avidinii]MBP2039893.1 tRNA A-37 threonylcarbamoyl transferase component Bud32 [Streptomyces avidinii]